MDPVFFNFFSLSYLYFDKDCIIAVQVELLSIGDTCIKSKSCASAIDIASLNFSLPKLEPSLLIAKTNSACMSSFAFISKNFFSFGFFRTIFI